MAHWKSAKILVFGYLIYAVFGSCLLFLPFSHKEYVPFLDDWFIAISASSTTGLASIDIASSYNFFGQMIIVILMQLGGIGYMTFSSFILLCTTGTISNYRKKIGASVFSVPKDFSMKEFIYSVMIFTFIFEFIGAVILSIIFYTRGVDYSIWQGVFHSVSAFCTAGLSLFPDSLMSFKDDIWLNFAISSLEIFGGLGFIVALDFYKFWTGKKKSISFTSKVILVVTTCFFTIGITVFFLLEPLSKESSAMQRGLYAFFQVVTAATTTGFNTVDIGMLRSSILILLVFCSTFGSAPSGTGGGLKNTAFATLLSFMKNVFVGSPVSIWNHEISTQRVKIATVTFVFYSFCMFLATFLLCISEKADLAEIFFEAANALNNSGLSMGLTSHLTFHGKILISLLMLIGRVGVLTFGFAISSQKEGTPYIGKRAELII